VSNRKPLFKRRPNAGWSIGAFGVAILIGSLVLINVYGGKPFTPGMLSPTGKLADLLLAYADQYPPKGLPSGLVDAAAKDACDGIEKMKNSSHDEREKTESDALIQSLHKPEADGLIPQQPPDDRLAQVRAVITAAERIYCPEVAPSSAPPSTQPPVKPSTGRRH